MLRNEKGGESRRQCTGISRQKINADLGVFDENLQKTSNLVGSTMHAEVTRATGPSGM